MPSAARFRERAAAVGVAVEVHEFPEGRETAVDAADAIGCSTAEMASSIATTADGLVVVVTSGVNRVDEERLAALRGVDPGAVSMADPETVGERLGWPVGGVPPFAHDSTVPVYLDETPLEFDRVWAAAGTPRAVFPVDPERIVDVADAHPAAVATSD